MYRKMPLIPPQTGATNSGIEFSSSIILTLNQEPRIQTPVRHPHPYLSSIGLSHSFETFAHSQQRESQQNTQKKKESKKKSKINIKSNTYNETLDSQLLRLHPRRRSCALRVKREEEDQASEKDQKEERAIKGIKPDGYQQSGIGRDRVRLWGLSLPS